MAYIDRYSANDLLRDGVALSFEDTGGAVFLTSDNAAIMSDDEIRAILGRAVITDGPTIDVIQRRGFDLGVECHPIDQSVAGRFHEVFTDDPLNPADWDSWTLSSFVSGAHEPRYTFDRLPDGARVLGNYHSNVTVELDRMPGACTCIFKTKQGGCFAVFGYGLIAGVVPKCVIARLMRVADAISPRPQPVVMLSESQAFIYPRVNDEGKTVSVSVANVTLGEDEIEISLRNPVVKRFVFRSQYGSDTVLHAEVINGEYRLRLPSLPAYSVGTVFCEAADRS